jgi:TonB family protein
MNTDSRRGTLLNVPIMQERYGISFLASLAVHAVVVIMMIFGGYLLPSNPIRIGGGAGGGMGGDISTVGVVDELSGGAGMYKPSIVPKPPALKEKPEPKDTSKAIPLPHTLETKKKKATTARDTKPAPDSSAIPTAPEPGSGGTGGRSGGSGGGFGGGNGVSIGPGSGAFGDSWYARTVENRISDRWTKPPEGVRVEMIFSFYILSNGKIANVKLEKSSGNPSLDRDAERAIIDLGNPQKPLPAPPPEFRGRPILFVAQFVYPPSQ